MGAISLAGVETSERVKEGWESLLTYAFEEFSGLTHLTGS